MVAQRSRYIWTSQQDSQLQARSIFVEFKKDLLWLEASSAQWYKNFESFMTYFGYHKSQLRHYVFIKWCFHADFLIILLYANDMCLKMHKTIALLTKAIRKSSAMKDLGPTMQIVGMKIPIIDQGSLFASHIKDTLRRQLKCSI